MDLRSALVMLVTTALLAIDAFFIVINLATLDATGTRHIDPFLYVGTDWALPAIFEYANWAVVALIVAGAFVVSRTPVYGVWAATFAYLAFDDALSLHERVGRVLTRTFMPGQPTGYLEIVPLAAVGVVVLAGLWYAHNRTDMVPAARRYSRVALLLGIVYGVFAVGVDILHVIYRQLNPDDLLGDTLLLMLEEGGELVTGTILVGYTLWAFRYGVPRSSVTRQ